MSEILSRLPDYSEIGIKLKAIQSKFKIKRITSEMNHISKIFGKTTAVKNEEQVHTFPLDNKVRN